MIVCSYPRDPVQVVEIGIDATNIAAIRPFWQAVLGPGWLGPARNPC